LQSEDVQGFVECGIAADQLFPSLRGLRPGQSPEKVRELLAQLASDMESIREIYGAFSLTLCTASPGKPCRRGRWECGPASVDP